MSKKISELRATSDEELIALHDDISVNTFVGVDFYLNELDRRSRERSSKASEDLARQTVRLAWATVLLSLVAVVVSVVTLIVTA